MKGLALHGVNDLFDLVGVRRESFETAMKEIENYSAENLHRKVLFNFYAW